MPQVTATLTVDFSAGTSGGIGDGLIKLELDSTRTGNLNGGKTSFRPNDNCYILLFRSSNVSISSVKTTRGSIAAGGTGNMDINDEYLTLSGSDTATLQYPVTGNRNISTIGNLLDVNGAAGGVTYSMVDDVTLQFSKPAYGILLAQYTTSFNIYRLSSVADRAMVVAFGDSQ